MTRRLYFAIQSRLERDEEGIVRAPVSYARYEAWMGYLQAFDEVVLLSRVETKPGAGGFKVEGSGVRVMEMPYYRGALEMLLALPCLTRFFSREVSDPHAYYGSRMPNIAGLFLQKRATEMGAPFLVQVVGDPAEVLRAGAGGTIGKVMAPISASMLRRSARAASAVIYVTRNALQQRYPASPDALVLSRSNVELPQSALAPHSRDYTSNPPARPLRLVTAGSQEQNYKGHDTLIRAVGIMVRRGFAVQAAIIGGGRLHEELKLLATTEGAGGAVEFVGKLGSSAEVRRHIENADIFILPSRTEGLPRVLIEAMATGVACVGSEVGGVPELLSEGLLFPPNDPYAIADLVMRISADGDALSRAAAEQWGVARDIARSYSGDDLLGRFLNDWVCIRKDECRG